MNQLLKDKGLQEHLFKHIIPGNEGNVNFSSRTVKKQHIFHLFVNKISVLTMGFSHNWKDYATNLMKMNIQFAIYFHVYHFFPLLMFHN